MNRWWLGVWFLGLTACFGYVPTSHRDSPCDSGGGCSGESPSYCAPSNYGPSSSYPPSSYHADPATLSCTADYQCDESLVCSYGRCVRGACSDDDECPIGTTCKVGRCLCQGAGPTLACGPGLTCTDEGTCKVCLNGGDACRSLTCDAAGRCPGALKCNETTLECELPANGSCSDDADCSLLMVCLSGQCRRVENVEADAGANNANDASPDSSDAGPTLDASTD